MNNRKWNAKNPNQGNFTKVLCVCSAGLLRSPTVAVVMQSECKSNTRAVGLEKDFALIPIDDILLDWADMVVVMDYSQAEEISEVFDGPIYNFSLADEFEYMNPELVEIIKSRLEDIELWRWN